MPASPSDPTRLVDERSLPRVAAVAVLCLAIAVAAGLAIAPAAANVQDDGATNGSATDTANETVPTELQPIDVANASGNDTEPITLSGEGQTVTDQFELEDGLVVAEYDHDGESNFQIELWNESADEAAAYPVNEIGVVDGATAEGVTAGNYSLEVTADGAWNVTLVQPNASAALATAGNDTVANATGNETDGNDTRTNGSAANDTATNGSAATTIASAPAVASGEGSAVVGLVDFERSVTVTANHSGESNFRVTIWPENATSFLDAAYVYNEIGAVEAAETRVDHQGISWVVINADGEWDLRFEER